MENKRNGPLFIGGRCFKRLQLMEAFICVKINGLTGLAEFLMLPDIRQFKNFKLEMNTENDKAE